MNTQKSTYLESSSKLSQLEARLNKNGYLSKGSLPAGADAKVFLYLEQSKKIPNRSTHPNLYYWYILMKQFSLRTLQIWQQDEDSFADQDKLIEEFIQFENGSGDRDRSTTISHGNRSPTARAQRPEFQENHQPSRFFNKAASEQLPSGAQLQKVKKANSGPNDTPTQFPLTESNKEEVNSPTYKKEYVMQLHLNTEENTPIRELKKRLENQQNLQLVSVEGQEENIRVVFKTEANEYEKLKDKISSWDEVSNLQFRKEKRVNTRVEEKTPQQVSSNGNL